MDKLLGLLFVKTNGVGLLYLPKSIGVQYY